MKDPRRLFTGAKKDGGSFKGILREDERDRLAKHSRPSWNRFSHHRGRETWWHAKAKTMIAVVMCVALLTILVYLLSA